MDFSTVRIERKKKIKKIFRLHYVEYLFYPLMMMLNEWIFDARLMEQ
jgi:hypothetical protein